MKNSELRQAFASKTVEFAVGHGKYREFYKSVPENNPTAGMNPWCCIYGMHNTKVSYSGTRYGIGPDAHEFLCIEEKGFYVAVDRVLGKSVDFRIPFKDLQIIAIYPYTKN